MKYTEKIVIYQCDYCRRFIYEDGNPVEKDDKLALKYFKQKIRNAQGMPSQNIKIDDTIKYVCSECFRNLGGQICSRCYKEIKNES